jgi:hypothetical protein
MTEAKQFLMWIFRKLFKLPKQLLDFMTDSFDEDWGLKLIIQLGIAFVIALIVTLVIRLLYGDHPPEEFAGLVGNIVWMTGNLLVATAGIRAMYRRFRAEQNDFFNKIKS